MAKTRKFLISVVDDDPSVCSATLSLLRANGFATAGFSSAAGFLASSALAETACLILDVRMPGMTGPELFRRLVVEKRGIPTIFMSAHGNGHAREEAQAAGAIDFLAKPFTEQALLGAIQAAVKHKP